MRFLLTNDDGFDAPGLEALGAAAPGDHEPLIVAPAVEQSGMSHSVTTHAPLRLEQRNTRGWAVDGSPADCVRLALHRFRDEFDFVLAGINSGGNLGVDVFHSGTIAAVREAAVHGVPGVAVSHYRNRSLRPEDWARAARWVRPLIEDLLQENSDPSGLWSINLPCLAPEAPDPETVVCPLDLSPLPLGYRENDEGLHYSGVYHQRGRKPGSDVDVCFGGRIAVTRVSLG